jgi:hypothetical protein
VLFKNFRTLLTLKPVLAVGFLFAVSSLLFGTWVAAIPTIKERFAFTDGSLGLMLYYPHWVPLPVFFYQQKYLAKYRLANGCLLVIYRFALL